MSTYVILDITVTDPEKYEAYKQLAPSSIAAYGGRYIVRGGEVEALEGSWHPSRIVVLEFESAERARAWLESSEYREARALRHRTAITNMVVVEGL